MNALRMLILLLATSVAWGGMLPVVARVVAGVEHVCHCKASEHDCVCVRCQPDRPELWTSEESLKGQCGDDDAFPSASGFRGIVATSFVVVAAVPVGERAPELLAEPHDAPSRAPPVPPPERLRAVVCRRRVHRNGEAPLHARACEGRTRLFSGERRCVRSFLR